VDPRFQRAAEAAADAYAAAGASAVLLAGSGSRDIADRFSDLDLYVVWEEQPEEARRAEAIARAGGTVDQLDPYDEAERLSFDAWTRAGVPFEVAHVSLGDAELTIEDVVERHDPDPGKLLYVSGFATGKPLRGGDLLARLRASALPYPDELATAVVRAHAQIDFLWQLEAHLERRNPLLAYAWVADVHRRLLHGLLAANRVYFFGFKRLDALEARLPVAPPRLAARIRETYAAPPAELAALVGGLAEETYDVLEQTVPGIDVDRLRRILRYRRTVRPAGEPA
jgi:hypothetical protein